MIDKKINILRIITWLPVGGIERRIVALLPKLDRDKFNVSLCCIKRPGILADELEKAGVPVHLLPIRSRLNPIDLWKLAKLIKTLKIDIVHTHMYRSNVPGVIAAKLAHIPIIISNVHTINEWESTRQLLMDKFLMRFRSRMVAVSEEVRDCIIKRTKITPEKCIVIYNGVDLSKFQSIQLPDESYYESLGLKRNDKIIIMAARLVKIKNHSCLFRAAKKVLEYFPNVKFLLVGDGVLRDELKAEVENLGIKNNVIFAGVRDDMEKLYAISHISVLPSNREGFSNVIVESMASGLPVIATDVGGNSEAIMDGQNGYIIKRDDDKMLTERIITLLKDENLRKKMTDESTKRAELFSLEKMRDKTEELYQSLYNKWIHRGLNSKVR